MSAPPDRPADRHSADRRPSDRRPTDRRFVADAEAHRRDAPRHCPSCAAALDLASEFWEGTERRFFCWCPACDWTGEITPTGERALGHEPEH